MKINCRNILFLLGLWFVSEGSFLQSAHAQNKAYSLQQCYEIALANSPNLKVRALDILSGDVAIYQAKMQFLPSWNAGASHGYNWGQSIDPFTNAFATGRVRTNNFAMRSSWDLFTGLMNRYNYDLMQVNKRSAEQNYELAKRNFKNEIATVYAKLQTDYLVKSLYEEQYNLSKSLLFNVAALEKSGRKSPFDKLRIEALVQQDSSAVLSSKNAIRYSEFVLNQLLNESDSSAPAKSFEILSETQMVKLLRTFSDWQTDSLQELLLAKIDIEAAQIQQKIAKSQLLPTLTLNSAIGSGYSGRNTELIGTELVPKPMDVQLRENFYQTAVLSLSVPIFNAYSVKSQIKLAQIKIQQSNLAIEQIEIDLVNMVEKLLIEYENEQINLKANLLVFNTNKELFKAAEKMFLTGVMNYAEFAEAKYALTQAQLNYLISVSKSYSILLILENIIG